MRPLSVIIHEMGHAIAGWFVTRKKILIFIGSYGNKKKSIKIPLKIFDFYFYKNPFKWEKGLCETEEKKMSINDQIIFILGGPIASLLIAFLSFLFIKKTNYLEYFFTLFLISSLIDFFLNIIPSSKKFQIEGGRIISNDGRSLINLMKIRRLPKEYLLGIELYNEKKYNEAVTIFENVLINNKDSNIYRMAIASNIQKRDFTRAKELADLFKNMNQLTSDDYSNIGLAYTESRNFEEALELYDKSLKLNPKNKFTLHNKGYSLLLLEDYHASIQYFDKAIAIDNEFSYSYNFRGLANIKTNKLEEGLADIKHSLKLDSTNSDAHKNLGIYYFEKGNFQKALEYYNKAKEIDKNTMSINELILEVQNKLLK